MADEKYMATIDPIMTKCKNDFVAWKRKIHGVNTEFIHKFGFYNINIPWFHNVNTEFQYSISRFTDCHKRPIDNFFPHYYQDRYSQNIQKLSGRLQKLSYELSSSIHLLTECIDSGHSTFEALDCLYSMKQLKDKL